MTDTVADTAPQTSRRLATPSRQPSLSMSCAASAAGVLVIAMSYAMGRSGVAGGVAVWWIGQLLLYVPLFAWALRSPALTRRAGAITVLVLGVETYLVKWFYSPTTLKFFDELQHVRGLLNAVAEGRVGVANDSLPLSQYFPGTQSISAGFALLTGANPLVTGLALSAVAHVAMVAVLYLLFSKVLASPSWATVATLVYCTNSSFTFFNSYFVYETLALPFMLLSMLGFCRLRQREGAGWGATTLGVLAFLVTLATHHISVFFLMAFVVLLVADVAIRRERGHGRLLSAGAACLISAAAYLYAIRSALLPYFEPYTSSVGRPGVRPPLLPDEAPLSPEPIPTFDQVLTYVGYLLLVGLVVYGIVLSRRARDVWLTPFGGFAAMFLVLLPLGRLLPFGGQIFGRATTFVYLGVGFAVAVVAAALLTRARSRQWLALGSAAAIVVAGLTVAVPAFWHRLPGGFYPKGYESGYDARVGELAEWVPTNLSDRNGFMTDGNGSAVLASLSDQYVRRQADQLFYVDQFDADADEVLQSNEISYAWVDERLATVRSPSARYFYGTANGYFQFPPTLGDLRKFDTDSRISRIYDDGEIRIYDMRAISMVEQGATG